MQKIIFLTIIFFFLINNTIKADQNIYLQNLTMQAASGDLKAQKELGTLYFLGKGIPRNDGEAYKWLMPSAQRGDLEAQTMIGDLYFYHENYNKSYRWLINAANNGNPKAQALIGSLFFLGKGVPQNYKEALKWVSLAVSNGDSTGERLLALMYAEGLGVPKDLKKALTFYIKIVNKEYDAGGDAEDDAKEIMYQIAQIYIELKNYNEAFKWAKKAAENKNIEAYVLLGNMYYKGQGIQQNYKEALKFYSYAAKNNNYEALYGLGSMYYFGQGVEKDDKKAYEYFYSIKEQKYSELAKKYIEELEKKIPLEFKEQIQQKYIE